MNKYLIIGIVLGVIAIYFLYVSFTTDKEILSWTTGIIGAIWFGYLTRQWAYSKEKANAK